MSSRARRCSDAWPGRGDAAAEVAVSLGALEAWVYRGARDGNDARRNLCFFSACASRRMNRVLLAQVAGHGDRAQVAATELRTLVQRHVNRIDHDGLVRAISRPSATRRGAPPFAAGLVATFFAPAGRFFFSNTGHPPPLVFRAATGQWSVLHGLAAHGDPFAHLPTGLFDLANYDQFDLRVDAGDLVLCYSESLLALRDAEGEMIGVGGLLELFRSLEIADASQVIAQVTGALRARCGEAFDDANLVMLLLRPTVSARDDRLGRRMLGPLRMMRNFLAALAGREPFLLAMPWTDDDDAPPAPVLRPLVTPRVSASTHLSEESTAAAPVGINFSERQAY